MTSIRVTPNIEFLSYADDVTIFLNYHNNILHLNYNKVKALSLSGGLLAASTTKLSYHQTAISFLGPLQRLSDFCSRQNSSILGRATVINSLPLSTCWYVLRVVPLPLSTLVSIKSILSKSIIRNVFPKASWKSITIPKSSGGLGILNPVTLQFVLFYRWYMLPLVSVWTMS
ncbi:hypothetical protein A0J61_09877 [Choanephora cucurbitarum]|uniref:Reverse transcriptase domain-containing protein n=1 Tax=Choanephora cucurbitarum TaxID=101091 RepID=A0A1C7N076_9FUNG|nr:hypothetical protein A0J61_09877 [Choanephora cucurbitarum]